MTLELIQLVQIAISALGKKAELDKVYFDRFIQPVWEKFSEIHQDYKVSFRTYTEFALTPEFDLIKLIELMGKDSVFTSDKRSELAKSIEHLPPVRKANKAKYTKAFIDSILHYFGILTLESLQQKGIFNLRWVVINSLEGMEIAKQERRAVSMIMARNHALELIMELFKEMQANYEKVADSYQKLKSEMLN